MTTFDISLRARGMTAFKRSFNRMAQDVESELLQDRMALMIFRVLARVTTYPPELPKQRYIRTGIYGTSWKTKTTKTSRGVRGRLTGKARQRGRRYTSYVSGDAEGKGQAGIHSGRWAVAREVLDAEIAKEPSAIKSRLLFLVKRAGL